jgi:hypothetical protein
MSVDRLREHASSSRSSGPTRGTEIAVGNLQSLVGAERAASLGIKATAPSAADLALSGDNATQLAADLAAWRRYRDANPFLRPSIYDREQASIERGRALDQNLPTPPKAE